MDEIERVTEAMHREKNAKICNRLIAVRAVLMGRSTADAAGIIDAEQRTVQLWMQRYRERGIDGLRDAPRAGRRPKAAQAHVAKLAHRLYMKNMLTPKKLIRRVRDKLHVTYSAEGIRRILRALGFSRMTSVTRLAGAAGVGEVRGWQEDLKKVVSGAKRRGFRIAVEDESIFVNVGRDGSKLWAPVGSRVAVERSGSRIRVVVYGAVADDGTRLMRTYDTFNAANFVRYLGPARKKWGKVLLIMDNASQHKSRKVRRYLERTPDVVLLYLPVARPELSAVEEVWRQAKYRLVTSEFYSTLDELKAAVSEHFRTCAINVDIYKYLMRSL